jgi:N-acyl-D-aspartate/D-glutamate deacylase
MSADDVDGLAARVAALEDGFLRLGQLEELRHLRARYCRFVDAKQWEELKGLLTPDYRHFATNTVGAEPVQVAASAEDYLDRIRQITTGATTVHACVMPDIDLTGPATATGLWSMTDVVSHPTDPGMRFIGRGHYRDDYRRGEDGVWRIAVTRLTRQRLDRLPVREAGPAPALPGSNGPR